MNIKIYQQLNEIDSITGTAVIIDVFRAFTVESYLLANNISKLYAVEKSETAFSLKSDNPDTLLIGERHGKIIDGFDYGNSPSQIAAVDFSGRTLVHTTSAGTRGIAAAVNASEILACGLVNAGATYRYLASSGANDIALVCMGLEASEPTEEDTLCARYIKALFDHEETIDFEREIEILKRTSGAKFFDPNLKNIFPEDDFHKSVEVDKFNFALKSHRINDEIFEIKKIEI